MENQNKNHKALKFLTTDTVRENLLKAMIPTNDTANDNVQLTKLNKEFTIAINKFIKSDENKQKGQNRPETTREKILGKNKSLLTHKDIPTILSFIFSEYPENTKYSIDHLDNVFKNLNYTNNDTIDKQEKCNLINTYLKKAKKPHPFDQYDLYINPEDFSLVKEQLKNIVTNAEYKKVDKYLSIGDYISAINIYRNGAESLEQIPFQKKLRMLEISLKYGALEKADEFIIHLNTLIGGLLKDVGNNNKLQEEYEGRLHLAKLKNYSQKGMVNEAINILSQVESNLKDGNAEMRLCSAYLRCMVATSILHRKEDNRDIQEGLEGEIKGYYQSAIEIANTHEEKHLLDLIYLYEMMIIGVTKIPINLMKDEIMNKIKEVQLALLEFKSNSSPNIASQTNAFSSLNLGVFTEAAIYMTRGNLKGALDCLLLANLLQPKSKANEKSEGFAELLHLVETVLSPDSNDLLLLKLAMKPEENNRSSFQDKERKYIPGRLEDIKEPFYNFYNNPTKANWNILRSDKFIKYYDISDDD